MGTVGAVIGLVVVGTGGEVVDVVRVVVGGNADGGVEDDCIGD